MKDQTSEIIFPSKAAPVRSSQVSLIKDWMNYKVEKKILCERNQNWITHNPHPLKTSCSVVCFLWQWVGAMKLTTGI